MVPVAERQGDAPVPRGCRAAWGMRGMRPDIAVRVLPDHDPDQTPPPARLRMLAGMVERLAVSGGTDPEQVTLGKLIIAGQLRRLARELDR